MPTQKSEPNQWNTSDMVERWNITKVPFHEELISQARRLRPSWNYVADIGCGWMGLLERAWQKHWPPQQKPIFGIGIDPDVTSIAKSQARVRHARLPILYAQGSSDILQAFNSIKFDVVFSWEVVYLLPDTQLDEIIANIRSAMPTHGIFLCGAHCIRKPPENCPDSFYRMIEKKIAPCKPYWRQEADYVSRLRKHGFSVRASRIRVSEAEYQRDFKLLPPTFFSFDSHELVHAFYAEYGKCVWICTAR